MKGKPLWSAAPAWAQWLAQNSNGNWYWHARKPALEEATGIWIPLATYLKAGEGRVTGDVWDTREQRPALTNAQRQAALRARLSDGGLFRRRDFYVHPYDEPALRVLEAELRKKRRERQRED